MDFWRSCVSTAAVGCACTATWLAKRSHLLKLIDAPSRLLYIGKINSLRKVGTDVPVRIEVGSVKEALLAAALDSDADVLMIGRSQQPGRSWPYAGLDLFDGARFAILMLSV